MSRLHHRPCFYARPGALLSKEPGKNNRMMDNTCCSFCPHHSGRSLSCLTRCWSYSSFRQHHLPCVCQKPMKCATDNVSMTFLFSRGSCGHRSFHETGSWLTDVVALFAATISEAVEEKPMTASAAALDTPCGCHYLAGGPHRPTVSPDAARCPPPPQHPLLTISTFAVAASMIP